MKFEAQKKGKITILQISGKMYDHDEVSSLVKAFDRLLEEGERTFIFDMTRVSKALTVGINAVVICRNKVVRRDGVIKLAMNKDLRWIYTTLFLDRLFEIHGDLEETLASFAA